MTFENTWRADRLTLTREWMPGRGWVYDLSEAGLLVATLDEDQARALLDLLRQALEGDRDNVE